jgi:hypothetical protein
MGVTGGYAAVGYVKQTVAQCAIKTFHDAFGDAFRRQAAVAVPTPNGPLVADGAIFLTEPKVKFSRRPGNEAELGLLAYARLRLRLGEEEVAAAVLRLSGDVAVPVTFKTKPSAFADVELDLSDFDVTRLVVEAVDLPGSELLTGVVLGKDVRDALGNEVRKIGSKFLRITLPTSQMTQIALYGLPFLALKAVRVLDGCIALCLDREFEVKGRPAPNADAVREPWPAYDASVGLYRASGLHGSPWTPLSDGIDVLVALNRADVALALPNVALLAGATAAGELLEKLEILGTDVRNDSVALQAKGTRDGKTARISLEVLVLPFSQSGQVSGWRAIPRNVVTDVDVGLFVAAFIWMLEGKTPSDALAWIIKSSQDWPYFDLGYRGAVPGLPDADPDAGPEGAAGGAVRLVVRTRSVIFGPDDPFLGGTFEFSKHDRDFALSRAARPAPTFVRPGFKGRRGGIGDAIEMQFLAFAVRHPLTRRDPSLRLTWRATALDGRILWEKSDWSDNLGAATAVLDLWNTPSLYPEKLFILSATITRAGDFVAGPLTSQIIIEDALDRARPFVRRRSTLSWTRDEVVDGQVQRIRVSKERRSVIHKTAMPGRCLFSDAFWSRAQTVEYLDALPPDAGPFTPQEADTGLFRIRLCQYCFFGGPDKALR